MVHVCGYVGNTGIVTVCNFMFSYVLDLCRKLCISVYVVVLCGVSTFD
jgi:hypothetical protein